MNRSPSSCARASSRTTWRPAAGSTSRRTPPNSDISRTPLREALKVLAAEGLVAMKLRGGAYVAEVSPVFEYEGMIVKPMPVMLLALQAAMALVPIPWLPLEVNKPSQFQALLLYLVVYVPSLVVGYHICKVSNWASYTIYLAMTAACLITLAQVHRLRPARIPAVRDDRGG